MSMEGGPDESGIGGGGGGGGHIDSFMRERGLGASPSEPRARGGVVEEGLQGGGGRGLVGGGGDVGRGFPRSVSPWQLHIRVERDIIELDAGSSSRLPFEAIEGVVQVNEGVLLSGVVF